MINHLKKIFIAIPCIISILPASLSAHASAPTMELPFTGDPTPFSLLWIIVGASIVVIVILLFSMRKK